MPIEQEKIVITDKDVKQPSFWTKLYTGIFPVIQILTDRSLLTWLVPEELLNSKASIYLITQTESEQEEYIKEQVLDKINLAEKRLSSEIDETNIELFLRLVLKNTELKNIDILHNDETFQNFYKEDFNLKIYLSSRFKKGKATFKDEIYYIVMVPVISNRTGDIIDWRLEYGLGRNVPVRDKKYKEPNYSSPDWR